MLINAECVLILNTLGLTFRSVFSFNILKYGSERKICTISFYRMNLTLIFNVGRRKLSYWLLAVPANEESLCTLFADRRCRSSVGPAAAPCCSPKNITAVTITAVSRVGWCEF
jgi:hypothetical protein